MAKKAVQEADEQQKLQTRYDRKMEKRRKQKEKEEKQIQRKLILLRRFLMSTLLNTLTVMVVTQELLRLLSVKVMLH